MKFTKEEISLCKQVAKKHIKPIKYGDWWISEDWWKNTKKEPLLFSMKKWIPSRDVVKKGNFPLWTISDCLEFLSKQMYTFERAIQLGSIFDVSFISVEGKTKKGSGDTLLEACLKVVLAVLEDKK